MALYIVYEIALQTSLTGSDLQPDHYQFESWSGH